MRYIFGVGAKLKAETCRVPSTRESFVIYTYSGDENTLHSTPEVQQPPPYCIRRRTRILGSQVSVYRGIRRKVTGNQPTTKLSMSGNTISKPGTSVFVVTGRIKAHHHCPMAMARKQTRHRLQLSNYKNRSGNWRLN